MQAKLVSVPVCFVILDVLTVTVSLDYFAMKKLVMILIQVCEFQGVTFFCD